MIRSDTRNVIPLGPFVLKVPSWKSWSSFVEGLAKNLRETRFYDHPDCPCRTSLCPIFALPGGFGNFMTRTTPLDATAWNRVQKDIPTFLRQMTGGHLDSFGQLPNGRVVAVDYGTPPYP